MWPAESIEIGEFQLRQLDRVVKIERSCFCRYAYPRTLLADLHRQCGPLFLVAKRSRRIAGYSVTCIESDSAEIVSVAVDPRHQRHGVATALLKRTIHLARRAGIVRIELVVRVGNGAAIRLYRRLGFRTAELIPGYYEDGADGLRMQRGDRGDRREVPHFETA